MRKGGNAAFPTMCGFFFTSQWIIKSQDCLVQDYGKDSEKKKIEQIYNKSKPTMACIKIFIKPISANLYILLLHVLLQVKFIYLVSCIIKRNLSSVPIQTI